MQMKLVRGNSSFRSTGHLVRAAPRLDKSQVGRQVGRQAGTPSRSQQETTLRHSVTFLILPDLLAVHLNSLPVPRFPDATFGMHG